MKYFAYSVNFYQVRRYLLIGVLASLCFSFSANLNQPALDWERYGDVSSPVIHAGVTVLLEHALITPIATHSERPARYRVKRPLAQLATLPPENFSILVAAAHHLSLSGDASLSYSSFSISLLRGRAPPRIT